MKPGELGRQQLEASQKTTGAYVSESPKIPQIYATPVKKVKGKGRATFFDLSKYGWLVLNSLLIITNAHSSTC